MNDRPTAEQIENLRTQRGGYTKAQLSEWGIPWPPPKGWRKRLIAEAALAAVGEAEEWDQLAELRKISDIELEPTQEFVANMFVVLIEMLRGYGQLAAMESARRAYRDYLDELRG